MQVVAPYAKAVVAAFIAFATYVVSAGFNPQDVVWWAAAVVFVGAAFGFVYAVPNKDNS